MTSQRLLDDTNVVAVNLGHSNRATCATSGGCGLMLCCTSLTHQIAHNLETLVLDYLSRLSHRSAPRGVWQNCLAVQKDND